ncbi:unnamed protein product [Closterium sp. NIES-53]
MGGVLSCVAFHPDPNQLLLVGASESGLVRVWDLVTKRPAASLDKHFSTVTSIAFSPSGWLLLTASRDKVGPLYSPLGLF